MIPFFSPAEQVAVNQWYEVAFAVPPAALALPFSFRYGDKAFAELAPAWECPTEEAGGMRTLTFRDPETGLEVRCEVRRYDDFAAVEWVLHFRNTGTQDTPIIADIQALDTAFALSRDQLACVHHAKGSDCRIDDFAPLVTDLNPTPRAPQSGWVGAGNPLVLGTHGGRSSNGALPFFNVQLGAAAGAIGAIGWTGDWAARFWRGDGGEVHAQAGMKRTHLKLLPGEGIRSPSILLLFWEGDRIRGHNALRRLILAHHSPRRNGEPCHTPISFAMWGMNRADRQLGKLHWFTENHIPLDNFWIDAGWHGDAAYQDNANVFNSDWGRHVGNWYPNKVAYPGGLAGIGDAAHAAGMDFTLWLEIERVFRDTQFTREHPEWLLGPIGDNYLFNLGNPEACAGLTDLVSSLITEGRVTVYRQDFNMDPAPFWEAADAPDRIGLSEIRHIEGLYAFWDALLQRHPGLLIDNCSSGGRRIDLETLSRSIPLWRSDFQCFKDFDPIGLQGQTTGLSLWAPLHSGCCDRPDPYALRSTLGPGLVFGTSPNPTGDPEGNLTPWQAFPVDWLRNAVMEQQQVRPYFEGDFYPLLSYTLADDAWAAWQFDRPDLGAGIVLALRRPHSPLTQMTARLHALDAEARYELRDADTNETRKVAGKDLAETGLTVDIHEAPGSKLEFYRRLP
ncbi:MAG: hypothetical protein FJX75_07180 [Armatimonadetes bacterium]|nr:hypothetical protein [Armatimonadota bacterium]